MERAFFALSAVSLFVKTIKLKIKKKYQTILFRESAHSTLLKSRLIKIQQEYQQYHSPQLGPKKISNQIHDSTKKFFLQVELSNQHHFKCRNFLNYLWLQLCNFIRLMKLILKKCQMLFWWFRSYKQLMFRRKKLIRRKKQRASKRFIQSLEDLEKKFQHREIERHRQAQLDSAFYSAKQKPVKLLTFTQGIKTRTTFTKKISSPVDFPICLGPAKN